MFYLVRSFLFMLPAETAHYFTMNLFSIWAKIPPVRAFLMKRLQEKPFSQPLEIAGIRFHNPLGIAAGFDKNARYFNELHLLGFGFVEIGTVTPKPQDGNPKPRLFRLKKDGALINRMGFNNEGVEKVVARLKRGRIEGLIIGGNIGKNKVTPNKEAVNDYMICFEKLFDHVDYFVVNVSSPNTPGLRELQEKDALSAILNALQNENNKKDVPKPIFLKIAPDLTWSQIDEVVSIVEETQIAGIITNNTTISRDGLKTNDHVLDQIGNGGLSGAPLKDRSRAVLQRVLDQKSNSDRFNVISSGGISTPDEAATRLNMGAQLAQLWTGFIYHGPGLIKKSLKKIEGI